MVPSRAISSKRIRYLATIWSDACRRPIEAPASWSSDFDTRYPKWVDQLEERGLVRRKPGGFIWITCEYAHCGAFCSTRTPSWTRLYRLDGTRRRTVPEIHLRLALWYLCILAALCGLLRLCSRRFTMLAGLPRNCSKALDHTAAVRAGPQSSSELGLVAPTCPRILDPTQGYSRGSCRRLVNIRDRRCLGY